jgi:hypothetical protein
MVKTCVSFGIRAEKLVPAQITAAIDVVPTKAWAKGDAFKTRTGIHQRPWGVWSLRSETKVTAERLEPHIQYILDIIEPKSSALTKYLQDPDYLVQVYIWYVGEVGFTLPSELLARLCAICKLVNFSFFEHNRQQPSESDI